MKYCYQCNHITPGEPTFCNFCGRSYNVKLCPRLHPNPRSAEACSRCGSRDISIPQPRVPWWVPVLEFLVSLVPGVFLGLASLTVAILFITAILQRPEMLVAAILLLIPLAILWAIWGELPQWFRSAIYKMLRRRRDGNGRNH